MQDDPLKPHKNFRMREDAPPIAELNRFLNPYGLTEALNDAIGDDGKIELSVITDRLPERTEDGLNPAHKELNSFLEAIPLKMRSRGVRLRPEKILSTLMDRLEFFRNLSEGLVRVCKGYQCEHYDACPFKDLVAENRPEDGIECMVDRQVVQGAIENYITPEDGKPKVDPRRPVMATLFEQLVQLLVKQRRYSMSMQIEDVLADHYEILQDGETDHFESRNQVEHPLMKAWDRNHKRIEKVLKAMGVTPEFEMRQDRWQAEDDRLDAEQRSKELMLEKLSDALKEMEEKERKQIEKGEGDPERAQILKEALASTKERAEQEKQPDSHDG